MPALVLVIFLADLQTYPIFSEVVASKSASALPLALRVTRQSCELQEDGGRVATSFTADISHADIAQHGISVVTAQKSVEARRPAVKASRGAQGSIDCPWQSPFMS